MRLVLLNEMRVMGCIAKLALMTWLALGLHTNQAYAQGTPKSRVDPHYRAFVKNLRSDAIKQGIRAPLFDHVFKSLKPNYKLPRVRRAATWRKLLAKAKANKNKPPRTISKHGLPLSCRRASQSEFLFPTRYFPRGHIDRLVIEGRRLKQKYRRTFAQIEKQYGVDIDVVLAIWGRETAFGRAKNKFNGMSVWTSLAFAGPPKKRSHARKELLAALKMVQDKHVSLADFKTSFSGATGYPQFEPLVFQKFAVDFDRDGKKDIWHSVPDAIASAARYIKSLGWVTNVPWGVEMRASKGFDCTMEAPRQFLTMGGWKKQGAIPLGRFPAHIKTRLIAPAGTLGPMFLTSANFEVFRRYNKADYYAIFVAHLSDRIGCKGKPSTCLMKAKWPTKDTFGFSVKKVCQLQLDLIHAGVTNAKADGLYGGQTRADIGRFQKRYRRPLTCFPTASLVSRR